MMIHRALIDVRQRRHARDGTFFGGFFVVAINRGRDRMGCYRDARSTIGSGGQRATSLMVVVVG